MGLKIWECHHELVEYHIMNVDSRDLRNDSRIEFHYKKDRIKAERHVGKCVDINVT